ncbi:MAG TPA: FGGY family carbohydrate kinase [Sumerlaeia bacterium]|nr:FGGY family carbohydrate kinase [Sumerlaeia bacterium]
MARLLLGIDVGASGVRAGVFDLEGELLGLGHSPCRVDSPRPGWAQCDPEVWWRGVVDSLRQACSEARMAPREIDAVGTGVPFPTVVALDAAGRALHPAILYCDQRSLAQVHALARGSDGNCRH